MSEIDTYLRRHRVLHRRAIALKYSRATVARRIRAGIWWRPTPNTVSIAGLKVDDNFWLKAAVAEGWPSGAAGGVSVAFALGLVPDLPRPIDISVAPSARSHQRGDIRLRRSYEMMRRPLWLSNKTTVMCDVGPSSLVRALDVLDHEMWFWFVMQALKLADLPNRDAEIERLQPLADYLCRRDMAGLKTAKNYVEAMLAGCESPGEAELWILLSRLRVRFVVQNRFHLFHGGHRRVIRSDFYLPDLDLIIEVDSRLHDHLADVRRDLLNLVAGRRTLRLVGRDLISDPRGQATLVVAALRTYGWDGSLPVSFAA